MLVSTNQLPDTSRLWIYQAERKLSANEQAQIENATSQFLKDWTAHGSNLKAAFELQHDQFLILFLDEDLSQASGCSIDASVNHIRNIENEIGISLINNDKVAFLIEDEINLLPVSGIKENVSKKAILPNTKLFNNTIQNLGEFKSKWLVDSSETWINRFFN